MEHANTSRRSVAVIGSGIAGLTAAYLLSTRHRVTLYEADTRLGVHAHTHFVDRGDGTVVGVDSAFLVHNERTNPTLCRLFAELAVPTQESDMSMSVRAEDVTGGLSGNRLLSRLEYAGGAALAGFSRPGLRCTPAIRSCSVKCCDFIGPPTACCTTTPAATCKPWVRFLTGNAFRNSSSTTS